MQPWMILHFALALATTISCIALIIGQLHIIERAEEQQWLSELRQRLRIPQRS